MFETLSAVGDEQFDRCLEVACSEGVFTELLAADPRIGSVRGMDISPSAVERARERLSGADVEVRVGDVCSEPFDERFDLIFCTEFLYYLGRGRESAAGHVVRALEPGGLLVLAHAEPEAVVLHRPFHESGELRFESSRVVPHATRPFRVCTLRRPEAGAVGPQ